MTQFAYLAALVVSIFCMTLLDRRFTLFFWRDARRASLVMLIGIPFFVVWDFAGITLGIFFRGNSQWMTGIELAPEFPIEEVFFLTLLCYVTMNAYGWLSSPPAASVLKPAEPHGARFRYGARAPTQPAKSDGGHQ